MALNGWIVLQNDLKNFRLIFNGAMTLSVMLLVAFFTVMHIVILPSVILQSVIMLSTMAS